MDYHNFLSTNYSIRQLNVSPLENKNNWSKNPQNPPSCRKMQRNSPACHHPRSVFKNSSTDLWRCCWYLGVSLNVCARTRACVCVCVCHPTQSIPPHSAHPHQNKHLHQAPKMRTRLSVVAGSPRKRPYQWPCQTDDTVYTQLLVPDTKHNLNSLLGFPLRGHFVRLPTVPLDYQWRVQYLKHIFITMV